MYIDEAGGSPLGNGIGDAMDHFAQGANSGSFAVSAEGGEALLKAIRALGAWIEGQQGGLDQLRQRAMLGGSHNAQVMSPFLEEVANDQQGFVTQLIQFRESLVKAEQGIQQAMANYQQTDSLQAGKFQ